MKNQKSPLKTIGIILFLIGLILLISNQGIWWEWLVLIVGVVLVIVSMGGVKKQSAVKKPAEVVKTEAPVETPEATVEEPKQE